MTVKIGETRDYFGLEMSSGAAHALFRIIVQLGKIEAIAMVRWKTGMGLKESKDWVEQFAEEYREMMEAGATADLTPSQPIPERKRTTSA